MTSCNTQRATSQRDSRSAEPTGHRLSTAKNVALPNRAASSPGGAGSAHANRVRPEADRERLQAVPVAPSEPSNHSTGFPVASAIEDT